MDEASEATPQRLRRQPPTFRPVAVRRVDRIAPRLTRVTLAGPALEGFAVDLPAASVRVLLPSPGVDDLVMPTWRGNEFLLPDGTRPAIRTFTPRRVESDELDIDVVAHGPGVASDWARAATSGDPAAVSGPGRGYVVDADASGFLLAGDESAIPAISQLLEALPATAHVQVLVEVAAPEGRTPLPGAAAASVRWCDQASGSAPGDALLAEVRGTELPAGTRVWAAGEAAAMQRLRRHLFDERDVPRLHATVRGYWKPGRGGDADADA